MCSEKATAPHSNTLATEKHVAADGMYSHFPTLSHEIKVATFMLVCEPYRDIPQHTFIIHMNSFESGVISN